VTNGRVKTVARVDLLQFELAYNPSARL
jgi:hypothetical protein